ncbi:unnamed protein product [Rotaria sp. Silwood1]|nr:unnamed protein product [Rotaria sp. Silwood1]
MFRSHRKLALAIGISDYERNIRLPNTINDARDMSSKLGDIGFIIDEPKLNLTYENMKDILGKFTDSIRQGDMVLIYFAGHGTQWEDQNFLIPKDDGEIQDTNIHEQAVHLQKFLENIDSRHPFATIILLDCCRTYYLRSEPLIKATARSLNSNTSNPIGLKEMIVKAGMLIAYACAPGTIANDVPNERNGLFTKHLLEHIGTPNKDIRMVVANVTNGVKAESRWKQIPHLTTNLSAENVYLFELSPGKY